MAADRPRHNSGVGGQCHLGAETSELFSMSIVCFENMLVSYPKVVFFLKHANDSLYLSLQLMNDIYRAIGIGSPNLGIDFLVQILDMKSCIESLKKTSPGPHWVTKECKYHKMIEIIYNCLRTSVHKSKAYMLCMYMYTHTWGKKCIHFRCYVHAYVCTPLKS